MQQEAQSRAHKALEGLKQYQESKPDYEPTFSKTIWRKGTSELNDFAPHLPANAPCILLVPSLINRGYIFDLYPQVSVVQYLAQQGIRALILDWNEPGIQESRFDCADYVTWRVCDALRFAQSQFSNVHLLGYCMGGILAMAASQVATQPPESLILLATPWDMESFAMPELSPEQFAAMGDWIAKQSVMPDWWSSALFQMKDPFRFQRKFARFTEMNARERKHFSHVEHWAQDGTPLSRYVAKECMLEWPKHNILTNGEWLVSGRYIKPQQTPCRTLIVTAQHDRIVPPESSKPLQHIANAHNMRPECGHISLVVGSRAKNTLWRPLLRWCGAL